MDEPHATKPACSICGWSMMAADHPRADGRPAVVCVNAECLEFGVRKTLAGKG